MTNTNQLVYLFPSFEDSGGYAILQPVLQWGTEAYNGYCGTSASPTWGISAWYGRSDGTWLVTSPDCDVNPNDELEGYMNALSCNGAGQCDWEVEMCDLTTSSCALEYDFYAGDVMVNAQQGVLEAYNWIWEFGRWLKGGGVNNCNQLPGGQYGETVFFNETWAVSFPQEWGALAASEFTPTYWSANENPNCGYTVYTYGTNEAELDY